LLYLAYAVLLGVVLCAPPNRRIWTSGVICVLVWVLWLTSGYLLQFWWLMPGLVVALSMSVLRVDEHLLSALTFVLLSALSVALVANTGQVATAIGLNLAALIVLWVRRRWSETLPQWAPSVVLQIGTAAAVALASVLFVIIQGNAQRLENKALPQMALQALASSALVRRELGYGVAWEGSPQGSNTEICALALHGANASGSKQPASRTVLFALHSAGIHYVALDHRGYGASPTPIGDDIGAWDPYLHTKSGYDYLHDSGCRRLLIVGHSLGITDAIRLNNEVSHLLPVSTVLFGGGLFSEQEERDQYWYQRFLSDRRQSPASRADNPAVTQVVGFDAWKIIRDSFYLNQVFAANYDPTRGTIVFVEFETEHENLAATRTALWKLLGQPEKIRFPSDHYFDTLSAGPLYLVNVDHIAKLASLFQRQVELLNDR